MSLVLPNQARVYAKDSLSPVVLIEGARFNTSVGAPGFAAEGGEYFTYDTVDGISEVVHLKALTTWVYSTYDVPIEPDTDYVYSGAVKIISRPIDGSDHENYLYVRDDGTGGPGASTDIRLMDLPLGRWVNFSIPFTTAADATRLTRVSMHLMGEGSEAMVGNIQLERAKFASTYIERDKTRAADNYSLSRLPIYEGPKTLNIAGYFDTTRPAVNHHYWWTHAGASFIRQYGDKLQVTVESIPCEVTIPATGWVAVSLRDDGTDTQVWVNGVLEHTLPASLSSAPPALYTPSDTEEYAFTYLAFGAAGLRIPFLNPVEAMSGIEKMHADWLAELEWGMRGMTYPPPF